MSDLREFDGDLVEALGPDFEVGMPVSCNKCLAGCCERIFTFNERDLTDLGRFSAVLGSIARPAADVRRAHRRQLKGSAAPARTIGRSRPSPRS